MSNNRPRNRRPGAQNDSGVTKAPKNFTTSGKKTEQKVVLFTVDNKEFKGPKDISPSFRIKIARVLQKKGEDAAVLEVMDYMLGDQYDELLDMDLPEETLAEIHTLAIAKVMGVEEDSPN